MVDPCQITGRPTHQPARRLQPTHLTLGPPQLRYQSRRPGVDNLTTCLSGPNCRSTGVARDPIQHLRTCVSACLSALEMRNRLVNKHCTRRRESRPPALRARCREPTSSCPWAPGYPATPSTSAHVFRNVPHRVHCSNGRCTFREDHIFIKYRTATRYIGTAEEVEINIGAAAVSTLCLQSRGPTQPPTAACPPPYTLSMPIPCLNRSLHAQHSALEQSEGDL